MPQVLGHFFVINEQKKVVFELNGNAFCGRVL